MNRDDEPTQRASFDDQPTVRGLSVGRRVIGRYVLESFLGQGGMGVVWRVKDEELGETIALKFLPELVARDAAAMDELREETRLARRLRHPNIVNVFDFVRDEGMAAVAMELVEGSGLDKLRLTSPEKILPVAQLAPLVTQLCAALDYAHTEAKIVHRDLKPANLLVTAGGRLKVTDFGIARSLTETATRLTGKGGDTSGTLPYMSPQQVLGRKPTAADDIYALGATLYELLTSRPPFFRGEPHSLMMQIREQPPLPLAEQRAELGVTGEPIPRRWEETILACLAKEPKDRPRSAGEVATRLGGAADAPSREILPSVDPTTAEKISAPPAREVRRSGFTPETSGSNPGRPRPNRRGRWLGLAAALVLVVGLAYYFSVYAPEQKRRAGELEKTRPAELASQAGQMGLVRERAAAEAETKRLEQQKLLAEQTRLAAARGGLIVRTVPPGAEVAVGGFAREKSPATVKDVKLGKSSVTIRLAGYEDQRLDAEIKENEFATLDVALVRSTGAAQLASNPPGLAVDVRNQKSEVGSRTVKTPAKIESLPTGDYELTFHRAGWPDQRQTLTVARNATAGALAEFLGGTLNITSTPSGAEVFGDGQRLGVTPLRFDDQPPGTFAFEFRLKGYKPASARGEVRAKETASAGAVLEKQTFPEPGQPWENTLGMKFAPVAGVSVLFGVWDVRVQDFEAFVRATRHEWSKPNFEQGPTHPAVNVSWDDAKAFCAWLTERERREGWLGPDQSYRLPQDWEWSVGVGLNEPRGGTPARKDQKAPGVYPWGTQWPPPRGAGNYGSTLKVDDFENTSPVGSFAANRFGLYDMGGNVWQWCEDLYDGSSGARVLRGASFGYDYPGYLLSSARLSSGAASRLGRVGFRCVVGVGSSGP